MKLDEIPVERQSPFWWDELRVPFDVAKVRGDALYHWLDETLPPPLAHDYILSTDGSGCMRGWGASAAIIQEVADTDEGRRISRSDVRVSAFYGSTVNRCELTALVDGLHAVVSLRLGLLEEARKLSPVKEPYPPGGPLAMLSGADRATVLWHTDRLNLAQAILFDEADNPLGGRQSDRDLWMRFSMLSKYVCISPRPASRNTVTEQRVADALCTVARKGILSQLAAMETITQGILTQQSWNNNRSQEATF